jgi:hypothetical protein
VLADGGLVGNVDEGNVDGTLGVTGLASIGDDDDGASGLEPAQLFVGGQVPAVTGNIRRCGASPGDTGGPFTVVVVGSPGICNLGRRDKKRVLRSVTNPDGSLTL